MVVWECEAGRMHVFMERDAAHRSAVLLASILTTETQYATQLCNRLRNCRKG